MERDEYIRAHRREVDLYAGIEEPLEIIKILHQPLKHDSLVNYLPCPVPIEEVYRRLNRKDVESLVSTVLSLFREGQKEKTDLGRDLVLELAAFTSADLTIVLEWLAREGDPYPALPFRSARAVVRDLLLKRVDEDSAARNHILCALAWVGDAKVVEQFAEWRASPPRWKEELYIPPESYAHVAGWELSEAGLRRDLFVSACHALIPDTVGSADSAVLVSHPSSDACGWCGNVLTTLLDLDRTDPRLQEIPWSAPRLGIPTCLGCTCFGLVYTSLDEQGIPRWSSANRLPKHLPAGIANRIPIDPDQLVLSKTSRPAHHAADQFIPTTFSQVGGLPAWIQDSEYPTCPGCRRTMVFVAQLCRDELEPVRDGNFYAFVCMRCRTTATHYQQT